MQSLNKKGVSEIVQVMSIVALSVIALWSVGSYVLDLSRDLESSLSPVVDCVQLQTQITKTCINLDGKLEININKPSTDNLNKILLTGENGFKTSCGNGCNTCLLQDGTKTIFIENSNLKSGDKIYLTTETCQSPISESIISIC